MSTRNSLEYVSYGLFAAGGLAILGGDKLSMPAVSTAGLAVAFLAFVIFGLSMIATRRAEIATKYSSTTSASFHVFRGWAAVAWGLAIALFAGVLLGYAVIDLAGWESAKAFFRERPGILIVLAGTIVTAWGLGSAGRATHRLRDTETPSSRWGDRIGGALAAAVGLCVVALGLLRTFAPSAAVALKTAVRGWLIGVITK